MGSGFDLFNRHSEPSTRLNSRTRLRELLRSGARRQIYAIAQRSEILTVVLRKVFDNSNINFTHIFKPVGNGFQIRYN
jgi:hypothetical protein